MRIYLGEAEGPEPGGDEGAVHPQRGHAQLVLLQEEKKFQSLVSQCSFSSRAPPTSCCSLASVLSDMACASSSLPSRRALPQQHDTRRPEETAPSRKASSTQASSSV